MKSLREIRELRDLTRTRRKLVGAMTSEKNRVQKVLEDANIKISSVVSKVFGVSSLAMICALLEKDELSADEIAEMARGKLKKKVDQLVEALNGNVTDHHRFLLKQHLGHIDFLVEEIKEFDEEIQRRLVPYQKEFKDIQSVTGIKGVSGDVRSSLRSGLTCHDFRMRHIYLHGQECVPETTRARGKKKSGKTRRGNNYPESDLDRVCRGSIENQRHRV